MGAISRGRGRRATRLYPILLVAVLWGCGAGRALVPESAAAPTAPHVLLLARVVPLETAGPTPPDTSVQFTTGTRHTIVLYHGGENIAFAEVSFEPGAFADSGRTVQVDLRPRPGVYGLDVTTSLPLQENQSAVVFEYARYFLAPARARQVYGNEVAFERALAVGRLLTGQVELLSSTRPAADRLRALLPGPGSYLVAAPQ